MQTDLKISIQGTEALAQRLLAIGDRVYRRAARRAVTKACRIVAAAAKARAPRRTGLLRTSIGQKVVTYVAKNVVVGIVGPRRGYRRAIAVKTSKRGVARLVALKKGVAGRRYADPTKYSHLVEFGTVHSAATHFLRQGWRDAYAPMQAVIQAELSKAADEAAIASWSDF